jgi:hypothetical protein
MVPGKKGGTAMSAYSFSPRLGNIDTLPTTLQEAA